MLIIETRPVVTTQTVSKQYYLLRDDTLIFVHAEASKGHALRLPRL